MAILDRECGRSRVGWLHMDDWDKAYGREIDTVTICPGMKGAGYREGGDVPPAA